MFVSGGLFLLYLGKKKKRKRRSRGNKKLKESIEYQEWNNFLCKLPNKWNQKWLSRFFFITFSSTMCANRQQSPPREPRRCSSQARGTHTSQCAGNPPIHGKTSCRFEKVPLRTPLPPFWINNSSSTLGVFSWAVQFVSLSFPFYKTHYLGSFYGVLFLGFVELWAMQLTIAIL